MKLKFLAGAALAATFAASGAYAQDAGWYGAVDAGWHQPEHFSVSTAASPPQTIKLHMDGGWAGFARVGYRFDPHWRLELEGGYRDGKVGTTLGFPFSGHLDDGAVMMNLVYDVAPAWSIHPFVGLGAGVDHEFVKETGGGVQFTTTGQNAFAWQGLAGLTWQASRQFNVDLTYRYFDGGHFDYNCNIPAACPVHTSEYKDDSLTIGLRYSFASPPPPAFVAKDFVVYFPFDQYVLTPEAQSVVQQAAQYSNDGHATRIVVVGHTDTSGSVKYNLRLSERRAKAVADAMVGLGVPQAVMKVDWVGKTDLAVPTPDGVKEPLNRRSTISINF